MKEGTALKNVLIHQSTEYDCGPTCLVNALRFLFERAEIPPDVLRHIWMTGMDTCCAQRQGWRGTSRWAMGYLAGWLDETGSGGCLPVATAHLTGKEAAVFPGGRAWDCLATGGCAVMRCWAGGIPHYVLLTALLPQGEVGLFDPYAEEPVFREPGRRVIHGEEGRMNRGVAFSLLNQEDHGDYAMGEKKERELVLLWRTDGEKEEKCRG